MNHLSSYHFVVYFVNRLLNPNLQLYLPNEQPFIDPVSNPGVEPKIFYMLSTQSDGSVVWSYLSGSLVLAQAVLTKQ